MAVIPKALPPELVRLTITKLMLDKKAPWFPALNPLKCLRCNFTSDGRLTQTPVKCHSHFEDPYSLFDKLSSVATLPWDMVKGVFAFPGVVVRGSWERNPVSLIPAFFLSPVILAVGAFVIPCAERALIEHQTDVDAFWLSAQTGPGLPGKWYPFKEVVACKNCKLLMGTPGCMEQPGHTFPIIPSEAQLERGAIFEPNPKFLGSIKWNAPPAGNCLQEAHSLVGLSVVPHLADIIGDIEKRLADDAIQPQVCVFGSSVVVSCSFFIAIFLVTSRLRHCAICFCLRRSGSLCFQQFMYCNVPPM